MEALPRDPQSESTGKWLAGSIVTHGAVVALMALSGIWVAKDNFGAPHASSGSVGVTMVKTVPIARREGEVNPLANDTKSVVPEAPAPAVKLRRQVVVPVPDAIALPDKRKKNQKLSPKELAKTTYRPPVEYKPNQVYSNTPQAANTPLYGTQGTGGIDIGPASVLGSRFGAYVDLMRDRISQHWNTADVRAAASQKCAVSFTIARSGVVTNVQISTPSGSYLLDTSAKRAILDASPLPPLPREFTQSEATVELWFQLKQ